MEERNLEAGLRTARSREEHLWRFLSVICQVGRLLTDIIGNKKLKYYGNQSETLNVDAFHERIVRLSNERGM